MTRTVSLSLPAVTAVACSAGATAVARHVAADSAVVRRANAVAATPRHRGPEVRRRRQAAAAAEDSRLATGLAGSHRWLTLLGFFGCRAAAGVHALRVADDSDPVRADRRPGHAPGHVAGVRAVAGVRRGECAGVHRRRRGRGRCSAPTCRPRSRTRGSSRRSRRCSWRWRCRRSACSNCSCRWRSARDWARSPIASAAVRWRASPRWARCRH